MEKSIVNKNVVATEDIIAETGSDLATLRRRYTFLAASPTDWCVEVQGGGAPGRSYRHGECNHQLVKGNPLHKQPNHLTWLPTKNM